MERPAGDLFPVRDGPDAFDIHSDFGHFTHRRHRQVAGVGQVETQCAGGGVGEVWLSVAACGKAKFSGKDGRVSVQDLTESRMGLDKATAMFRKYEPACAFPFRRIEQGGGSLFVCVAGDQPDIERGRACHITRLEENRRQAMARCRNVPDHNREPSPAGCAVASEREQKANPLFGLLPKSHANLEYFEECGSFFHPYLSSGLNLTGWEASFSLSNQPPGIKLGLWRFQAPQYGPIEGPNKNI